MPSVDALIRFIRSHGIDAWENNDGTITIEHLVSNSLTGEFFYELEIVAANLAAVRDALGY